MSHCNFFQSSFLNNVSFKLKLIQLATLLYKCVDKNTQMGISRLKFQNDINQISD